MSTPNSELTPIETVQPTPNSYMNQGTVTSTLKIKKRKGEIKAILVEILSSSSLHGLPNILRSSNRLVIITWAFFLLVSASIGFYFTVRVILDYLSYKTTTTIDFVAEQYSPFPAVSFCFNPPVNFSLNESITRLRFDRVDFNKSEFGKYFEQFNDPEYGICFRFNSERNFYNETYDILNSTTRGLSYGLRLDLYLVNKEKDYDFVDLYLDIHNQSLPPLEVRNGGGLSPVTGGVIIYQVERTFNQMLDEPYSSCLKDINLFKINKTIVDFITKQQNRKYSQKDCYFYCSYLYALENSKCGCNSSLDAFAEKCLRKPYEITNEMKNCVAQYLSDFRKNDQFEKCSQYCPLECDEVTYSITPVTKVYPSRGNISDEMIARLSFDVSNLTTYEQLKKHYVQICVFYKKIGYTLISQEAKTETFNFVSNIGGVLGLFLGISFLSFIEIFEVLIECCFKFHQ